MERQRESSALQFTVDWIGGTVDWIGGNGDWIGGNGFQRGACGGYLLAGRVL
jgi:hypothetical protein